MKEQFLSLYNHIINSEDEKKMHVLGMITKEMMMHLIDTEPKLAQEYIERLESVKWCNYLTDKEADNIVAKMMPKPEMTKAVWRNKIDSHELEACDEPYYNENALYVDMCKIMSDSGEVLKKYLNVAGDNDYFDLVYHLALGELKDKDKVFDIRKYFNV